MALLKKPPVKLPTEADLKRMQPSQLANLDRALLSHQKEKCEESLAYFVRTMWDAVEPGNKLIWGWPLDAMCEHLEAVTRGEIRRIVINVPPGFMKSLLLCVFWPAWEWGPKRMPHLRYIAASYTQSLTARDNRRFRNLIVSDRYVRHWGHVFGPGEFSVIKVGNDKTGWKIATSVGGLGTGERGDRVLIDDANNVKEAESEAVMETTNQWLTEVLPDRFNDMKTGVTVNLQQRTAENDATATLLGTGVEFCHLMIPMEYDPTRRCQTEIGWEDPRTDDGELAWPERFPEEVIDDLKRQKGSYAYAGQYQQSPSPRGGGILKAKDWQIWPPTGQEGDWTRSGKLQFPPMEYIIASLDSAFGEKQENDYSACCVLGVFRDIRRHPKIMLMTAWQDRLTLNDLVSRVGRTCRKFGVDRLIIEAKASGISASQEIERLFGNAEWGTELFTPRGDKVSRAYAIQHILEDLMVYAPDMDWSELMIDNCASFPKGAHDDLCDSFTQGLLHLRNSNWALRRDEEQHDEDQRAKFTGPEPEAIYDV